MKKHLLLYTLCTGIVLSFAGVDAAAKGKGKALQKASSPKKHVDAESEKAKEWLRKNATDEMKKLIAHLRVVSGEEPPKSESFFLVRHSTPEWNMFLKFPDFVKEYYYRDKFRALIFEDMYCPLAKLKQNGKITVDAIRIHMYSPPTEITPEGIKNFDADGYF